MFTSEAKVNSARPKAFCRPLAILDRPRLPGHQNQIDDISLAQILGHNLLGPNASLSVGQSYKNFYVVEH